MTRALAMENMLKVLKLRKLRAELSISEQKIQVANHKQQLEMQQQVVCALQLLMAQNIEYRNSIQSDARKFAEAFKHRKKVQYELERETYYEEMARDDLNSAKHELHERIARLEKIKTKKNRIEKLTRQAKVRKAALQQDITEEEHPVNHWLRRAI